MIGCTIHQDRLWKPFDPLEMLGDFALGEAGLPTPLERSLVLPVAEHILPQLPDNDSEDPVFFDNIEFDGIWSRSSEGPPALVIPENPPLPNECSFNPYPN
jgi:hypothetical protein